MGTSQSARAPNTSSWKKVASALKSPIRNSATVVDLTLSAVLPLVPANFVNAPIGFGIYEGLKFSTDIKEKGFDRSIKDAAIRISEKYLVTSITNQIWEGASSKIDRKYSSSPFGKLTEIAFKKTISGILTKGVQSLEE